MESYISRLEVIISQNDEKHLDFAGLTLLNA